MVKMLLWNYTNEVQPLAWMAASLQTANSFQMGTHTAKRIRKWVRAFMNDRTDLSINLYGSWNVSLLDKGELAREIHLHLQEKGKWVRALDIVHFLDTPDIKERYSLKKNNFTCNRTTMDAHDGLSLDQNTIRTICRWA
jgi:hypothetical protein